MEKKKESRIERRVAGYKEFGKRKGLPKKSFFSDPLGARTQDPNIKSVVLYLLS